RGALARSRRRRRQRSLHWSPTMAPLSDASPIRVALIDDDSGLLTVLERRLGALRLEIVVLAFPPHAAHLSGLRLHALIVTPRLTGLEYIDRVASALP